MQPRYLSYVLFSFIVLGVSSAALPKPRGQKRDLIRSGVFGGPPMQFKNSNDYYRKQSNDPYRRKIAVKPVLDLTQGVWDEGSDASEPARTVDLESLFNKNGMFYLSAPGRGKPGRNEKSLLQKQLDQDYISLELLGNIRGPKSRYPKKRGQYSTYSNQRDAYLPYSNKRGQYSPYSNKRGKYLPYSNKRGQYSPYSNKSGQYLPYSNKRGQYLPYSNKRGQYLPYSNKRGKYLPYLKNKGRVTTYSKTSQPGNHKRPLYGDRDDLYGFQDLVSLVQSYGNQKNVGAGSQKYRHPAGSQKKYGQVLSSYNPQESAADFLVGQPVAKQPHQFLQGKVDDDKDYKEEVLAILRDVRQRGGELEEEDAKLQEFWFEELVS